MKYVESDEYKLKCKLLNKRRNEKQNTKIKNNVKSNLTKETLSNIKNIIRERILNDNQSEII